MFLWWCHFLSEEAGCFVIAETRQEAKRLYLSAFNGSGMFNTSHVWTRKLKAADGFETAVIDDEEDTLLLQLGVSYDRE